MGVKCLRGLFQSLIHGLFNNYQISLLISLITVDIILLYLIAKMRKLYSYRSSFVLSFAYFFIFITFDITLLIYSIELDGEYCLNDEREQLYNLVFAVIILLLLLVSGLRILLCLGISLYLVLQNYCGSKVRDIFY